MDQIAPDRQHTIFHPEALAWLVGQMDDEERREFFDEVRPLIERFQSIVAHADEVNDGRAGVLFRELSGVLNAWQCSVQLEHDVVWVEQVEDAEARWERGGSHTFTTVKEMRDALAS